jgi:hypothetical protein
VINRFDYHEQLFNSLDELLLAFLDKDPDHDSQSRVDIAEMLSELRTAMQDKSDYIDVGQRLLCRLVGHFPALTPHIQRDLFWFFGGDCLHFMADEEIEKFQQLEDKFYEVSKSQDAADYADIRAQVFGLH